MIALAIGLVLTIIGGLLTIFKPTLPFFGGSSEPVVLKYWGLWEPESVMQPLIAEYQASHPGVTIQYERRSPSQYRETVLSRLSEGIGPDLFRIHSSWLPMMISELSEMPSSVYSTSDMQTTFYPTVQADLSSAGKYYAVPLMFDGLALIYNDDFFKAAGLTTPPETWNDVRQTYAPKLTQYNSDGSIKVAGIALGTSTNIDNFSDILGLLFLQNGTKMIEGGVVRIDKTTSADGRNVGADALDFYTLFAKKEFSSKGAVWSETLPASTEAFAAGKVAMVIVPSYRVFDIINLAASNGSNLNFKVAPVPQALPASQKEPVEWSSYWAEGVAKRSKNQSAAWDFLKFLSSKDGQTKLFAEQSKTRPYGELPSRADLADLYTSNRFLGAYVSGAKFAKGWYLSSGTFDRGINDQIISYFGDAVTATVKGSSALASLETAAKGASQVLARYGLAQTSASEAGSR